MPDGHRIAIAIFTRGGSDRPRTIAEAARAIYDGFKSAFAWPFGAPALTAIVLLHIVARGKIGRSPEADLVDRYLKRIAWPTKVTELPDRGGKMPATPRQQRASIVLDERGKALSSTDFARKLESLARRRQARSAFPDRRRGRPRRTGTRQRRPAAVVRARDLAASAGPGDAGRAIVPGDFDPCEPSLSSRRLRPCARSLALLLCPLLAGKRAGANRERTARSRSSRARARNKRAAEAETGAAQASRGQGPQ